MKSSAERVIELELENKQLKDSKKDYLNKYIACTTEIEKLKLKYETEIKQLKEDLDLCHKVLDLKIQKLEKIRE